MIYNMYTVYDEKAEAFLQPFFMEKDAMAIRAIIDCVSDPGHRFCQHASDFTLFRIGKFDSNDGCLLHDDKKSLGCLVEFKPKATLIKPEELDQLQKGDI